MEMTAYSDSDGESQSDEDEDDLAKAEKVSEPVKCCWFLMTFGLQAAHSFSEALCFGSFILAV